MNCRNPAYGVGHERFRLGSGGSGAPGRERTADFPPGPTNFTGHPRRCGRQKAEQIAAADRDELHSFTPTTTLSPGGRAPRSVRRLQTWYRRREIRICCRSGLIRFRTGSDHSDRLSRDRMICPWLDRHSSARVEATKTAHAGLGPAR